MEISTSDIYNFVHTPGIHKLHTIATTGSKFMGVQTKGHLTICQTLLTQTSFWKAQVMPFRLKISVGNIS
uniref:Uncharacterized protein n=1 Tax=Anguilla anguilla TaxID=7936 RepID=A0A0E9R0V5_ANGAN